MKATPQKTTLQITKDSKERIREYQNLIRELEEIRVDMKWTSRSLRLIQHHGESKGALESKQLKEMSKEIIRWKKYYEKILKKILLKDKQYYEKGKS